MKNGFFYSLREIYIELNYYFERGVKYLDKIKQPAILLAVLKIFNIPTKLLLPIAPVLIILMILIGWVDKKFIKIWQRELDWAHREMNPYSQEVLNRIKAIEKILSEEK